MALSITELQADDGAQYHRATGRWWCSVSQGYRPMVVLSVTELQADGAQYHRATGRLWCSVSQSYRLMVVLSVTELQADDGAQYQRATGW